MQALKVPTVSISEVKRSPGNVFKMAKEEKNGVYVFNRGTVNGVMLTQEQYESLTERIEMLMEKLIDMEAERRLALGPTETFTDDEVRGEIAQRSRVIDMDDGWD